MRFAGLIGDPVEHSLSPVMHNAAFRALGLEGEYRLWQTTLDDLAARIDAVRDDACLGANVTVPHKQAVLPYLDEVSTTARRIGAVNTIIPRDGTLAGDNTDAYGFARSLEVIAGTGGLDLAIVVGAGGAARAVLVSLQEQGAREIWLVNRTIDRAEALAADLASDGVATINTAPVGSLPHLATNASVLVNATSIGWHGDELPFDASVVAALPGTAAVMDLTYRSTALLRLAAARGLRSIDGLPMLVHQGARAFTLWTGREAPVEVMTRAVEAEQARRA